MKSSVIYFLAVTVTLVLFGATLNPVYPASAQGIQYPSGGDDETEQVTIYGYGCDGSIVEGTTGVVKGKEELSGTWIGQETGQKTGQWSVSFTIAGTFEIKGPNEWYRGKYACDSTQTPKYLNLYVKESNDSKYVGQTCLTIYKIEASTLSFASSQPGIKSRPNSFSPADESRVLVLKQQK